MVERLMLLTLLAISVCVAAPTIAGLMQAALPTLGGVFLMLVMLKLARPPRRRR